MSYFIFRKLDINNSYILFLLFLILLSLLVLRVTAIRLYLNLSHAEVYLMKVISKSRETLYNIYYTLQKINVYRKIFSNWFYVIHKLRKGEKDIDVVLKNGSKGKCNIKCILILTTIISEFSPINSRKFNFDDNNRLYYDNNLIIQENNTTWLLSIGGFIKNNDYWFFPKYNVKFNTIEYDIFETFILERYYTEIQGEVIDIGANIGDSAIYFALKGASHVYAFEPLPLVYKAALQNTKLNNLENKITLINGAVGSKEGKVKVPLNINLEDSGGFYITNQGDVEVPLFSFDDIVKNMVKDPYLLKMDCEGCEADIILNSDSISYFEKILVESHPHITKVSDKALLSKLRKLKYKCEERYRVGKTKLFYCSKIN